MLQELTRAEGHYHEEAGVAIYTPLWDHLILAGSAPLALGLFTSEYSAFQVSVERGWAAGSYCFVYTIPGSTCCQLHWSRWFPALIYSPGVGSNKSLTKGCPPGQRSICQLNKILLPTVLLQTPKVWGGWRGWRRSGVKGPLPEAEEMTNDGHKLAASPQSYQRLL